MRRKDSLFLQLVLVLLLLTSCTYSNAEVSPTAVEVSPTAAEVSPTAAEVSPTAMETTVPTASPAPVSIPFAPPGVETSSTKEIIYDSELAAYISVEDNCTIVDYGDFRGEKYRCGVFNLRSPEYEYTTSSGVKRLACDLIYWEIVVLQNDDDTVVDVLRIENDEYGDAVPACEDLVTEIDADFDGANDLLLCLGHFGAQGTVVYKCWLTRDNGLIYCPSFTEILNPALDSERKELLSQWRNWAASHSWGIYRFFDDAFVMTERLTEQPVNERSEEVVWSYTDEIFVDGAWQVREYFTEDDYDDETLYSEKVYGDTAYWDIGSDRWRTLYNDGKMSDFSIYQGN